MLSDALYKSGIDQLVKELVNSTDQHSVPTYYYMLNTTLEALKLPYWREVRASSTPSCITERRNVQPSWLPEGGIQLRSENRLENKFNKCSVKMFFS